MPTVRTALNKDEHTRNRIKSIHGDMYDLSLVKYTGAHNKIILICEEHGEFNVLPSAMFFNKLGCPACRGRVREEATKTTEQFIKKSTIKHKNTYDYSKVVYMGAFIPVVIICEHHGEFKQKPTNHLRGAGCHKCGVESKIRRQRENSSSCWSYSDWEESGFKSKSFDSFKLYIIRCWNENESFIKIGKTFQTLNRRFGSGNTKRFPYSYKVISCIEGNARYISKKEHRWHKASRQISYTPLIRFSGDSECFLI